MAQNKYELKHLEWFIRGSLIEYFKATGQNTQDQEFEYYLIGTINKVQTYLATGRGCDASFSDWQCEVAMAAKKVFGEGAVRY